MGTLFVRRRELIFIQSVCAHVLKGSWNNLTNIAMSNRLLSQILVQLSADVCLSWAFFKWAQSLPHYQHSLLSAWTMVHFLTKNRQFKTARELLEKFAFKDFLSSSTVLSSLLSTHDDPEANTHILSWLMVLYSGSRLAEDAIQIFDQMKIIGLRPDLHACNALLSTLAKTKQTATAWKVYFEMLSVGVVPNIYIYNVMIHVCHKSGDVERAGKLIREMDYKGIFPDLFTFNTLISLFCRKGLHYEALAIQERMSREGVTQDIMTYNSLIHGFAREELMNLMKHLNYAKKWS